MYDEVEIQRGKEAEEYSVEKFVPFIENFKLLKENFDSMQKLIENENHRLKIYYMFPKGEFYR